MVEGFFNNVDNAGKLDGLVEDIRDTMIEYQVCVSNYSFLSRLIVVPDFIATRSLRWGFPDYRKPHLSLSVLADYVQESVDLALLDRMYHTPDAGYRCGNRPGCLRGTRKDVLWEIEHWLTAERGQQVFWLNGLAGTGKSTVAQTFAETSFADGKLGASFFCSRDLEDRSNLQAIFPTLAFQLAYQYSSFRAELLQVLKAHPDVGWESLCSQMEKLIASVNVAGSLFVVFCAYPALF